MGQMILERRVSTVAGNAPRLDAAAVKPIGVQPRRHHRLPGKVPQRRFKPAVGQLPHQSAQDVFGGQSVVSAGGQKEPQRRNRMPGAEQGAQPGTQERHISGEGFIGALAIEDDLDAFVANGFENTGLGENAGCAERFVGGGDDIVQLSAKLFRAHMDVMGDGAGLGGQNIDPMFLAERRVVGDVGKGMRPGSGARGLFRHYDGG